jgi:hypothetical protein
VAIMKLQRNLPMLAGLGFLLAAGCAHKPAEMPPAALTGPPVSSYSVPAQAPKGMVHVVSFGLENLPANPGAPTPYLHIRLAAVNSSDDAVWRVDPNNQLLSAAGVMTPPSFAEASGGGPVLSVKRGTRGYLDVYYPAPKDPTLPVALGWRLERGAEVLAESTVLQATVDQAGRYVYYRPAADDAHVGLGHGLSSWWWNDYYFWNNGGSWWCYPRSHFHHHYPHHAHPARPVAVSAPEPRSNLTPRQSDSDLSSWRGVPARDSDRPASSSVSSWRESPPPREAEPVSHAISSNASLPPEPPPPPPPPPPSNDGKSSWRGGSGP